jgi:hypothetical protein
MGEKVSEAPEPVPHSSNGHGARTLAPAAAAVSSLGASSAESSSGSETLSEEGEPGGFSCRSQPPPPPGGAPGARLPTAWAPARMVLERGVPMLPLPPPGGAAPAAPRDSSASQEEQDEEVGPAFSHLAPSRSRLPGDPGSPSRARAVGRGELGLERGRDPGVLPRAQGNDSWHPPCISLISRWLLPPRACISMCCLMVSI